MTFKILRSYWVTGALAIHVLLSTSQF